jgi:hypothetical protein
VPEPAAVTGNLGKVRSLLMLKSGSHTYWIHRDKVIFNVKAWVFVSETRVTIGWYDLTGKRGTEQDIADSVKGLNRMSALITLARINILLAVDRFRRENDLTIKVQSYLVSNFLDEDVFSRLKEKFGPERLDVRSIFHSQQVLLLARYVLIYGAVDGEAHTENSKEARAILGKSLLFVSDLLVSPQMASDLRNSAMRQNKKSILLQLSSASGLEVNNPPNIRSSVVRSDALFGNILNRTPSDLRLAAVFKDRTGMEINEYVDFNTGALVNYIVRDPIELMEKAEVHFLNPEKFFPTDWKDSAQKFWNIELGTLERYREELTAATKLVPHHNFTPFRKRPFFPTNGTCIPIHPCFVQEKLEAGLFWTIFHVMKDDVERDTLFSLWGRLFETYIVEALVEAAKGKNQFIPFPKHRDNKQEAFDGILANGTICLVFECKAGFLKAESKFSEDPKLLLPDLEAKFGSSKTGALRQMASNITQLFNKNRAQRREIDGLDLTNAQVIVPVLVVQERFVSSPLTGYFLAESFRSELRKQRLTQDIDCQCQGLIVIDADDVEALRVCNSNIQIQPLILETAFFERSRHGDVVYDFHDFLIGYAQKNQISLKSDALMDSKVEVIFNRISKRFFGLPLTGPSAPRDKRLSSVG